MLKVFDAMILALMLLWEGSILLVSFACVLLLLTAALDTVLAIGGALFACIFLSCLIGKY